MSWMDLIFQVEKHLDEGMFQCLASNDLDVSFSSAQLRVLAFPPSFGKDPLRELSFVAEGENVTIPCNPEGAPQPDIVWYDNQKHKCYPKQVSYLFSILGGKMAIKLHLEENISSTQVEICTLGK